MKFVLSVLFTATFYISAIQCANLRVRRQNDAIFFPGGEADSITVSFVRPGQGGRRPNNNLQIRPSINSIGNGSRRPMFSPAELQNMQQFQQMQQNQFVPNQQFQPAPQQFLQNQQLQQAQLIQQQNQQNQQGQQNSNNGGGSPNRRSSPTQQFLRCMKTCPTTTEYNPVCGSDQIQYHNPQRLQCANRCGANVSFVRRGNCSGNLPTNTIRF